jgi:trk system potassium uptake protein TrkA
MFQNGNNVVVIDQSETAFQNLPVSFRGRTLIGQAMDRDVLRRAEIKDADALAAVTNNDAINAVIGHLARMEYQVPNVVVRTYDSRWRQTHEMFGLQNISSSSWGAQRIEELLYHREERAVFSAGNGEVEIYEILVPWEWEGRLLRDLVPEKGCVLAALTRAGRAMLPQHDMKLSGGDIILVSATLAGSEALRAKLKEA